LGEPIIKVEGISKKYIIGHQQAERYTALRDVITNKVKEALKKTRKLVSGKAQMNGVTKEDFWALRDISFEINEGDRVGIIGRNGAGKSTLLKILSRITEPTSGRISMRGRVASLLEVGTGFHPELTGRENVFLNGAILGMSRAEIRKKFDEIVAFAEVEKFLDTPVKRYSSGMYVRLAFAVAAHLEPEILIVDEVLAVGDAQFQQKCLGKMEDVSRNEGRTVLFVSHNMGVISQLCNYAIMLREGKIKSIGGVKNIVNEYMADNSSNVQVHFKANENPAANIFVDSVKITDDKNNVRNTFSSEEDFIVEAIVTMRECERELKIGLTLQSKTGDYISTLIHPYANFIQLGDKISCRFLIKGGVIVPNNYFIRVAAFTDRHTYDVQEMIGPLYITDTGTSMAPYEGLNYGYFNLNHEILKK
jgi:lipopolysaccharide transport system ATP-binding protein